MASPKRDLQSGCLWKRRHPRNACCWIAERCAYAMRSHRMVCWVILGVGGHQSGGGGGEKTLPVRAGMTLARPFTQRPPCSPSATGARRVPQHLHAGRRPRVCDQPGARPQQRGGGKAAGAAPVGPGAVLPRADGAVKAPSRTRAWRRWRRAPSLRKRKTKPVAGGGAGRTRRPAWSRSTTRCSRLVYVYAGETVPRHPGIQTPCMPAESLVFMAMYTGRGAPCHCLHVLKLQAPH